jgi:hypothetical protein
VVGLVVTAERGGTGSLLMPASDSTNCLSRSSAWSGATSTGGAPELPPARAATRMLVRLTVPVFDLNRSPGLIKISH